MSLTRHSPTPLTQQLSERFSQRIRDGLLAAGVRLPSVRQCAQLYKVSTSTVVAAYDQLMAQGLIEARPQRGFFVRETRLHKKDHGTRHTLTPHPIQGATAVEVATLIRGMLHAPDQGSMPALGILPPAWLDLDLPHKALRRLVHKKALSALACHYGEPAGDNTLRLALSHQLLEHGLQVAPEQLITTHGATQALDIVSRALLRPGDAVLVDDPGWAIELARLKLLGVRLLAVPRDSQGPNLAMMEQLAAAHAPKIYITVSVLHNPTSSSLQPHTAYQILRLAEQFNFRILEDDVYAWLAPAHATRLSTLDGLKRCIYVSSFSKIMAPGWRVGYLAAPSDLYEQLLNTKLVTALTTSPVAEQAIAWCLEQGWLRRQTDRVIQQLDAARNRSVQLAQQAGCQFVSPPNGLFGWLDVGIDSERLMFPLLDAGWLIAPGAFFYTQRPSSTYIRINFAGTQHIQFWRDFKRVRQTLLG